jgi:hypothetical protein
MNFLNRFFPPPDKPAMKLIAYRGGVLTFRIPSHWREEYSDSKGGTFYEDRPDSGTLQLRVTTMINPGQLQRISGPDLLQIIVGQLAKQSVEGTINGGKDGNAVLKYEQSISEQGTSLTIFYWVLANPLPDRHTRVATFSYTVLAERRNHREFQCELEMLESEIEAATFSPQIGDVAE